MHRDAGHLVPYAELEAGEQVLVDGVHPAGPEQADQVQGAAGVLEDCAEVGERLEAEEVTALDALGDPHQILGHHPAGAQVEVADLGVPHLPLGEPHGEAAGLEQRARLALPQAVPHRGPGEFDRVALAGLAIPPAVQHDERHGTARV